MQKTVDVYEKFSAQVLVVDLLLPPDPLVPLAGGQRTACCCCQVAPWFLLWGYQMWAPILIRWNPFDGNLLPGIVWPLLTWKTASRLCSERMRKRLCEGSSSTQGSFQIQIKTPSLATGNVRTNFISLNMNPNNLWRGGAIPYVRLWQLCVSQFCSGLGKISRSLGDGWGEVNIF